MPHTKSAVLASLVAPMTAEVFLMNHWMKTMAIVPGQADKYEHLFSWERLNEVLSFHRLESPRLRLFRKGREVPPHVYRRNAGIAGDGTVLRSADVLSQLSDGASLIIDEIEETTRVLREVMVDLESELRVSVHCNMYAGWRTDNAFLVHWDPHDAFILQIAGSKLWRVWRPTRAHPLYQDAEAAPPPDGAPDWAGELTAGGLLYLPRGWWHVANPLDEATLHLTVSVNNRTGIDLLNWIVKKLRRDDYCRMDIPQLGSAAERREYLRHLKEGVVEAISDEVIDEYLESAALARGKRPEFGLPQLTTPSGKD